jgi:chromosome segregation ATPase
MAKKKKRAALKTANRTAKTTAKINRGPSKKKGPAKRSTGSKSVDAILKRFANERRAMETRLNTSTKSREEIETKATRLREQIAKLAEQEKKIRDELAQLDAKRDREVSQLLSTLGVQLRDGSTGRGSDQDDSSGGDKTSNDRFTKALAQRGGDRN